MENKRIHTYQDVADWVRELLEMSKNSLTLEKIEEELDIIHDLEDVANGIKTHNDMRTDARCTVSDYEESNNCEVE